MTVQAFIFPGQGGQYAGQGADWAAADPDVAALFALADSLTGRPVSRLSFQGPLEELSETRNLQPAALTVGLAAAKRLVKAGARPSFAAGHSLGEFGALALAGALTDLEVLKLVAKRSELMQRAAEAAPGAMSAILGLDARAVEAICELARHEGQVTAANYNAPLQTVVSGEARAVAAAARFAALKGGKAVPLPVSGAFHSPLMAQAAEAFASLLDEVEFRRPLFPVVPNALGRPVAEPAEIKEHLKRQMTSPVRWTETVSGLVEAGVDEFLECWPKAYLAPLVKKSLPQGSSAVVRSAANWPAA
ncbi:MAG: ACP S-malonyltransferase [Deltaproteobacteria bacterium]|jgi:[acyl-carrier-protein] S-malonyltransferase|nr:ACP S-malonyltransferase [Deltaproteobacteria bacterium]